MRTAQLLDHRGMPVRKADLKQEVAAASIGAARSPLTGTPADGLNPTRLAGILRDAQGGDPVRFLELAEFIEERDLHYVGVLGTRRRSVTQIPIRVEAASDSPEDEARAELVRKWLKRGELADEFFDILDTIGKGYSLTEIIWDTSEGQWMPQRLEWRDPRWFKFDRVNLTSPRLITETGQEVPLPAYKFVFARIKAKSGIPTRGGLARIAAWSYLFKKFTERDWAIFCQTYGHPVRVGKYGPGATDEEKRTLLRAVQNIAGDMAGIIPESMQIEFVTAQNTGAAHGMYLQRCEYLDKQVSKAVLGQTATTDAEVGGLGSGKEHRQVQKDIETADATALAAVLNRDLIQPWMKLEFGAGLTEFPRIVIEQPEQEDLAAFASAIGPLIDRGLEVDQEEVRAKFGLKAPEAGAKLMRPQGAGATAPIPPGPNSEIKGNPAVFKRGEPLPGGMARLRGQTALQSEISRGSPVDDLTDRMEVETEAEMEAMLTRIEAMIGAARSMEELRVMLLEAFPKIEVDDLADVLAKGMLSAYGGGASDAAEESEA